MSQETFNDRWFGLDLVSDEISKMSAWAERWAKDCMGNKADLMHALVLTGTNGTGKSRVLRGLYRYFTACRMTAWEMGLWGDWHDGPPEVSMVDWIRCASIDPRKDPEHWEDLTRPDVLLIDDIGAEADKFSDGANTSNLALLLGKREFRWTAITTNILPEAWPAKWGRRVTDRLHRHSTVVTIRTTPSYALKGH